MRSSIATLQVLRTFFDDPAGAQYGVELMASSELKAGTLYPILDRLELDGWIVGRWEDIDEFGRGPAPTALLPPHRCGRTASPSAAHPVRDVAHASAPSGRGRGGHG